MKSASPRLAPSVVQAVHERRLRAQVSVFQSHAPVVRPGEHLPREVGHQRVVQARVFLQGIHPGVQILHDVVAEEAPLLPRPVGEPDQNLADSVRTFGRLISQHRRLLLPSLLHGSKARRRLGGDGGGLLFRRPLQRQSPGLLLLFRGPPFRRLALPPRVRLERRTVRRVLLVPDASLHRPRVPLRPNPREFQPSLLGGFGEQPRQVARLDRALDGEHEGAASFPGRGRHEGDVRERGRVEPRRQQVRVRLSNVAAPRDERRVDCVDHVRVREDLAAERA
mmetsp:Transcript_4387/g.19655  ORF Transcript_4387/g.19655 Transcript_4387/m.19655 type:complete len:280 (+) Transcript_4387:749-1588(+)